MDLLTFGIPLFYILGGFFPKETKKKDLPHGGTIEATYQRRPRMPLILLVIVLIFWLSSLKQINEYERGVIYTMGKFSGIIDPGWKFIWPIFQTVTKVDIRTKAVEVP